MLGPGSRQPCRGGGYQSAVGGALEFVPVSQLTRKQLCNKLGSNARVKNKHKPTATLRKLLIELRALTKKN